jgi:hypothetical protein
MQTANEQPGQPTVSNQSSVSQAELDKLSRAVRQFYEETGRAPGDLNEIKKLGYVSSLPKLPRGKKLVCDASLRVHVGTE